ncbi:MAG: heme-binding domain-containing protein [Candidatus Binataceae bacterium]
MITNSRRIARCFLVCICIAILPAGCSSTPAPNERGAASPASLAAEPRVADVLGNSCFDCHSDQGSGSWNAKLAPTYLFGAHKAREVLNFSNWSALDAKQRSAIAAAITTAVESGSMPPGDYAFLHPSARLDDEQKKLVTQWAAAQTALPAH